MVGKKEYAQINELLNARLDAKKVLIAVHRGAWGGNIIEGTVPSLELALKMGADMFECDLLCEDLPITVRLIEHINEVRILKNI